MAGDDKIPTPYPNFVYRSILDIIVMPRKDTVKNSERNLYDSLTPGASAYKKKRGIKHSVVGILPTKISDNFPPDNSSPVHTKKVPMHKHTHRKSLFLNKHFSIFNIKKANNNHIAHILDLPYKLFSTASNVYEFA